MRIEWTSLTDMGLKRSFNEDAVLELGKYMVFAAIDGMGGVASGMEASRLAMAGITAFFEAPGPRQSPFVTPLLVQALQQANRDVRAASKAELVLRGIGAAIAAIQIAGEFVSVAHVGDCRVYRYANSKLTALTEDHSLLRMMLQAGKIDAKDVDDFPHKHVITRALGISDEIEVECKAVIPEHGDVFLLCSDGLHGMLDDWQLETVLGRELPSLVSRLDYAAKALVEEANAAGGNDNIAVVLVRTTWTRLMERDS